MTATATDVAKSIDVKSIGDDGDEEEESFGLDTFFINEDYRSISFYFGNTEEEVRDPLLDINLLASPMCCTDWDLTGQIIWPAALQLSYYILYNQAIFRNKRILELGSGAGLSGLIAAKFAENIVLTDGNEIVMKLLESNAIRNKQVYPNSCIVEAERLYWGDDSIEQVKSITEKYATDIIIGADIVMWPNFIEPLSITLNAFFDCNPNLEVHISYVERATSTTKNFESACSSKGMTLEIILPDTFIPPGFPLQQSLIDLKERFMYKITRTNNIK